MSAPTRTLHGVRASGTGAQVSATLIAAGTAAAGSQEARRRIINVSLDPGLTGTAVMVRIVAGGTTIYQISATVGGGAQRHSDLSGVDNYNGLSTQAGAITYVVSATAGTETWFLNVEYEPR